MPEPYQPQYSSWRAEFEHYDIDENTLLVGHSYGAGFLIRWLSEHPMKIAKLVLVAPWLDPSRRRTTDFSIFKINPKLNDLG